jgi:hypothetical protein
LSLAKPRFLKVAGQAKLVSPKLKFWNSIYGQTLTIKADFTRSLSNAPQFRWGRRRQAAWSSGLALVALQLIPKQNLRRISPPPNPAYCRL